MRLARVRPARKPATADGIIPSPLICGTGIRAKRACGRFDAPFSAPVAPAHEAKCPRQRRHIRRSSPRSKCEEPHSCRLRPAPQATRAVGLTVRPPSRRPSRGHTEAPGENFTTPRKTFSSLRRNAVASSWVHRPHSIDTRWQCDEHGVTPAVYATICRDCISPVFPGFPFAVNALTDVTDARLLASSGVGCSVSRLETRPSMSSSRCLPLAMDVATTRLILWR
jgi:hypothetical protein